ncbi:protein SULFUR DEFICIENCY-INDUCED 1-like [Lycium ferocissimum]|uniref:protein SULFUR DEFICIENCY-INDUCED 1-like n=1 Tax=Lycium ferocissimum TaxID=112874 RepID=UPI002814ED42|nr:protein SULFUR DEFICIENCY-INDUCED 1-like [Lycium ferocissimum]
MKNYSCSKKVEEIDSNYRVIHKLPPGDSPYVRAKYAQLVEKDPEGAIVLFWKAINAGDRIDSALKDMAVVMKQQDKAEEAFEAIKSFRYRCSKQTQESLDNVLIDLYKVHKQNSPCLTLNK